MQNCNLKFIGLIVFLFVYLAMQSSPLVAQATPVSDITVIEGTTVIDGISSAPIKDAILVIEGSAIRYVGRRGSFKDPANARKIDMSGKTIIPGIFCVHGHLARTEGLVSDEENFNRARIERDAKAYLYYGITHMLSLGDDREPMIQYLADQRAGKTIGARLYTAGLGFGVKGGWPPNPYVHRPTTPEEARTMAKTELAKHPDVLKIWIDDRLGTRPHFPPDIYGAIIDEAHAQNVKTVAHIFYLEDAKEAMRRGISALGHSVQDREVDEDFLTLAKKNNVTQMTTLTAIRVNLDYAEGALFLDDPGLPLLFPKSVLATLASAEYRKKLAEGPELQEERWEYEIAAKNAKTIADRGIPIAIGTDSGRPANFPGLWEHREMELLVRAGLSPMDVIRDATINGAKFLGVDSQYGSITPKKVADFIVLDADPLQDIANSRRINAVWMNGSPVDRSALGQEPQ